MNDRLSCHRASESVIRENMSLQEEVFWLKSTIKILEVIRVWKPAAAQLFLHLG